MWKCTQSMVFACIALTPMFGCGDDSTAARIDAGDEVGEDVSDESASASAGDGASESGTADGDENAESLDVDADADADVDADSGAKTTGADAEGTATGDGDMSGTTTDDGSTATGDGDASTGDGDTATDDLATEETGSAAEVGELLPEPCMSGSYLTLTAGHRNQQFNDGDGKVEWCDRLAGAANDDEWKGTNWYRFMGAAGTQMPEFPPMYHSCGGEAPGWLLGDHPAFDDGVVDMTVCFSWSGDTCHWEADVQVVDCGDFYVYNLPNTQTCALRYCGNG